MKKFLVIALLVVMTLAFCSFANAVVYEFKEFAVHGFSIDAPEDWTVSNEGEGKFDKDFPGGVVYMSSPDGSTSMTFLYASSEGLDARSFAWFVAGHIEEDCSDPVENGYGGYEFSYTENGGKINIQTRHVGHLGIVMKSEYGFDDFMPILDTLVF